MVSSSAVPRPLTVADTIHIFVATDQRLAAGTGIALTSVLARTSGPIHVTLVQDGVSDSDLDALEALFDSYRQQLTILDARERSLVATAFETSHVTRTAYYRLNMAEYLPLTAKRAIYLDGDVLCLRDLRELWNEPLDGFPIAAIADPSGFEVTERGTDADLIGLPRGVGYFNSGVLLVDLEQWRREEVGKKLFEHVLTHPRFGRFVDQGRLNAHFAGRWKELPLKYNLQSRVLGIQMSPLKPVSAADLADALKDAIIVHFNGPCKAWQARTLNPFTPEFKKVWRQSPWRDWGPEQQLISEWRWKLGDLRRNWRQYLWCRKQLRSGGVVAVSRRKSAPLLEVVERRR